MGDSSTLVTRRRLLGGVAMIGGASSAAGAGTMAFFSDSESSTNNTVQAGTLNLTIEDGNADVSFFTETNIVPGDSDQATLSVTNTGSISGYLDVSVASLVNYENGLVGNENSADDTGGNPGEGNGELQNYLEVIAYFENGGNPIYLGSDKYETLATKFGDNQDFDVNHPLSANGGSDTFIIDWQLPSDTGREATSDSVELELNFELGQTTGQ